MVSQLYGWHLMSYQPVRAWEVGKKDSWSLTHVLSAKCKCSQRVTKYLEERGPQKDVAEEVLVVGEVSPEISHLKIKGFSVRKVSITELSTEDLNRLGVPFLLITTPKGETVYAGGYSERSVQDGGPLRDLEILRSLQGHGTPKAFPIFGCAISRKLQKLVDPLAMKYSRTGEP